VYRTTEGVRSASATCRRRRVTVVGMNSPLKMASFRRQHDYLCFSSAFPFFADDMSVMVASVEVRAGVTHDDGKAAHTDMLRYQRSQHIDLALTNMWIRN
jgi:hypothetical protein